METAVITPEIINPADTTVIEAEEVVVSAVPFLSADELIFELGLWLSGLESFLNIQNHAFGEENRSKAASRDWTKEFRLTHSTLLQCSSLNFKLAQALKTESAAGENETKFSDDFSGDEKAFEITPEDIFSLSMSLKEAILLSEGLLRAAPLKFGEWTAWSKSLTEKLKKVTAFEKLIKAAEKTGEHFLPARTAKSFKSEKSVGGDRSRSETRSAAFRKNSQMAQRHRSRWSNRINRSNPHF